MSKTMSSAYIGSAPTETIIPQECGIFYRIIICMLDRFRVSDWTVQCFICAPRTNQVHKYATLCLKAAWSPAFGDRNPNTNHKGKWVQLRPCQDRSIWQSSHQLLLRHSILNLIAALQWLQLWIYTRMYTLLRISPCSSLAQPYLTYVHIQMIPRIRDLSFFRMNSHHRTARQLEVDHSTLAYMMLLKSFGSWTITKSIYPWFLWPILGLIS